MVGILKNDRFCRKQVSNVSTWYRLWSRGGCRVVKNRLGVLKGFISKNIHIYINVECMIIHDARIDHVKNYT